MDCAALDCAVLDCAALDCAVLDCAVLDCAVLDCAVLDGADAGADAAAGAAAAAASASSTCDKVAVSGATPFGRCCLTSPARFDNAIALSSASFFAVFAAARIFSPSAWLALRSFSFCIYFS